MKSYQPPANLLQERCILITGASRGIGHALALGCAAVGARCILLARNTDLLGEAADAIVAAGGVEPLLQGVDLERLDYETAVQIADALAGEIPALHGLVNNAAILGRRQGLDSYPAAEWQRVMQVNLTAPMLLTSALMPLLKQAPDASIVNVSSGVGRRAAAHWGAYAVSKFALESYSANLALEIEATSNIRVNTLDPGGTRTDMRAAAKPAEDPQTLPSPETRVNSFLYLLGRESLETTGQQFTS